VAAILAAALAIAVGLLRWRRTGRNDGGPPRSGGTSQLEPAEAERLEADLARYDL
jgi:hypothetical protein